MERFMQTVLLLLLILTLAGCGSGGNSTRKADNGNAVENAINEQMEAADTEQSDTETETDDTNKMEPDTTTSTEETTAAQNQTEEGTESTESGNVDYDLTVMNSDMVYATVYQMMVNPDSYVGKTVKMTGPFYPYTNTDGTVYYPACVIEDATACCAQGMEFVLNGAEYPDGYPEMGTTITVTGTFETYQEDGNLYCHLADASLETPEE